MRNILYRIFGDILSNLKYISSICLCFFAIALSGQQTCMDAIDLNVGNSINECLNDIVLADSEIDFDPIFIDTCGGSTNDNDFWWGHFTATDDITYFVMMDITLDEVSFILYEAPCSDMMEGLVCVPNLRDLSLPGLVEMPTIIGQDYYILLQHKNAYEIEFCLFSRIDTIPTREICEDDLSFENGMITGWDGSFGSYHFIDNCPNLDPVWDLYGMGTPPPRFELINGGFDVTMGPLLERKAPGGGQFSYRIGSDEQDDDPQESSTTEGEHASAERMRYCFIVEEGNAGFGFNYALVVAHSSHSPEEQPTFEVYLEHSETGDTIDCGHYLLFVGDEISPFSDEIANTDAVYSDWTTILTDLSGYENEEICVTFQVHDCEVQNSNSPNGPDIEDNGNMITITFDDINFIEFEMPPAIVMEATHYVNITNVTEIIINGEIYEVNPTDLIVFLREGVRINGELVEYWGECQHEAGTHWMYAYFDTYCTRVEILTPEFCVGDDSIVICAPEGYIDYLWEDGPGMEENRAQRCVLIENPMEGVTYVVNMISVTTGCSVNREVELVSIPTEFVGPSLICEGDEVRIELTLVETNPPYNYEWSTGSEENYIDISEGGWYQVSVTNGIGCESVDSIFIEEGNIDITCAETNSSSDIITADGAFQFQITNGIAPYVISIMGPENQDFTSILDDHIISDILCGFYTISVMDSLGCFSSCEVQVNCGDCMMSVITETTKSCIEDCNGSILINGDSIYSYIWNDGNMDSIRIDLCIGGYSVTIEDENGCLLVREYEIEAINEMDFVLLPYGVIGCNPGSVSLNASGSLQGDVSEVFWVDANVDTISSNGLADVNQSGDYTLILNDPINGCSRDTIITVLEDFTLPTADAGIDLFIDCQNPDASLILDGTNSSQGNNFAYKWESVDGNPIQQQFSIQASIEQTGAYVLTVTNIQNGCIAKDTVQVDGILISFDLDVVDVACPGDASGSISIINISGGEAPYAIFINEIELSGISQENLGSGEYNIRVEDANGCLRIKTTIIEELSELALSLGADLTLESGSIVLIPVTINVEEADLASIQWNPSLGLSCSACLNPSVTANETSLYTLTVIDEFGCVRVDSIKIKVISPNEIYIPNVFSPNADGLNDKFTLYSKDRGLIIESMQVFDRWGELIFHKTNFNPNNELEGWDGYFKTQICPVDVYIYSFRIRFSDGSTDILFGDLLITR